MGAATEFDTVTIVLVRVEVPSEHRLVVIENIGHGMYLPVVSIAPSDYILNRDRRLKLPCKY